MKLLDKMIVVAASVMLIGCVAMAEDWGKPITGTFTNYVTIDLNKAQYQTLKYIYMGVQNTNGQVNTYTAFLEHTRGSLSVSNKIAIPAIAAESFTNVRTAVLSEYASSGSTLNIANTNTAITNFYFIITEDIKH